jgi:hypothetical protein
MKHLLIMLAALMLVTVCDAQPEAQNLLNALFQVTYGPQGNVTDIHMVSSTGNPSVDARDIEVLKKTRGQTGIHLLWMNHRLPDQ